MPQNETEKEIIMNRVLCIAVALACFVALSQLMVQAQTVTVDDGTNAEDYTSTGPAVGVTTGTAGITIVGDTTATGSITATTITDGIASLNGGALTGATTIDASGTITGGTITDGTASLNGGALTGATTINASGTITGGTITDGTANLTGGVWNGVTSINGASTVTPGDYIVGNDLSVVGGTTLNTGGAAGTQFTVAAGTGDTAIGGALDVTGATTLTGLLTANGGASINGVTNINGTTIAAGTGNTAVAGTLGVAGNTALGGTLGVTGTTTLTGALTANGGETINNGSTIWSGAGIGNQMTVDAASARFVSADGTQSVEVNDGGVFAGNAIGGLLVDNTGNIDLSNANAGLTVNNAGGIGLGNANAGLSINDAGTVAVLSVDAVGGAPHGLYIDQTQTVLSGGTNSTTLTLNNAGATFQNTVTGGPAGVHGVADGIAPFDAVNVRQLDGLETRMSSGIASVAALAAIPGPVGCKNYSAGLGYGNYNGESAVAVGLKANLPQSNISLAIGAGFSSSSSATANAGIAFSF